MKTIVVYRSKSGFVKNYAQWIAEELKADIYEASKITPDRLTAYDTVIFGGGLYAAGINGIKLITGNMDKLKDKKIAIFFTGATPPREDVIPEIRDKNFTAEQQKYIKLFYLRGGFDYQKLTFTDKIVMLLMKGMLKSKKNLTPDERGMLSAFEKPVDFTRKKNIDELITYVINSDRRVER